jgi:hypothetical protein
MNTEITYTPGSSGAMQVQLPVYKTKPDRCIEPYSIEVLYAREPAFKPAWITNDDSSIIISTDANLVEKFTFLVISRVGSVINDEVSFTINFDCIITDIIAPQYPPLIHYFINPQVYSTLSVPLP